MIMARNTLTRALAVASGASLSFVIMGCGEEETNAEDCTVEIACSDETYTANNEQKCKEKHKCLETHYAVNVDDECKCVECTEALACPDDTYAANHACAAKGECKPGEPLTPGDETCTCGVAPGSTPPAATGADACQAGQKFSNNACEECPEGQYSFHPYAACYPCTTGSTAADILANCVDIEDHNADPTGNPVVTCSAAGNCLRGFHEFAVSGSKGSCDCVSIEKVHCDDDEIFVDAVGTGGSRVNAHCETCTETLACDDGAGGLNDDDRCADKDNCVAGYIAAADSTNDNCVCKPSHTACSGSQVFTNEVVAGNGDVTVATCTECDAVASPVTCDTVSTNLVRRADNDGTDGTTCICVPSKQAGCDTGKYEADDGVGGSNVGGECVACTERLACWDGSAVRTRGDSDEETGCVGVTHGQETDHDGECRAGWTLSATLDGNGLCFCEPDAASSCEPGTKWTDADPNTCTDCPIADLCGGGSTPGECADGTTLKDNYVPTSTDGVCAIETCGDGTDAHATSTDKSQISYADADANEFACTTCTEETSGGTDFVWQAKSDGTGCIEVCEAGKGAAGDRTGTCVACVDYLQTSKGAGNAATFQVPDANGYLGITCNECTEADACPAGHNGVGDYEGCQSGASETQCQDGYYLDSNGGTKCTCEPCTDAVACEITKDCGAGAEEACSASYTTTGDHKQCVCSD